MMRQHQTTSMRHWLKGAMFKLVPGMITCKEFDDFLVDYLDGLLSDKQKSTFELHLKFCRECREYLAAYKRSIEMSQAVLKTQDDKIPEDVPEDLIRAILEARDA